MKSTISFMYLMLISFLKLAFSEECMTPTQVAGTCIDFKDCPLLRALVQTTGAKGADFANNFTCRFEGNNPIVCCPGRPGESTEQSLYGPLLPPQCGFSNVSHTKIVGGLKAKLNAWPWMASLGYKETPDSPVAWRCGGTLISTRHVLTAAHCAIWGLFIVRLGDLNLIRDDDGAHPIDVGIEKVTRHPQFERERYNDVAVIRLEREIQFTYNIHPICLPVGRIRYIDFVNTNPFVVGWGLLEFFNEETTDDLMEVQVPVITTEACAKAYPEANVNDSLICTGVTGGKDSCKGDSGGPVMIPINGFFYEIGVIMGGEGCALLPGKNTRVTSVLQFIISNLQ